jgi:alkaline phosphatase D
MSSVTQSSRILFASCNSQHYEPVLWPAMTARHASTFVWVGDAVYADDFHDSESFWRKGAVREATPAVLKDLYEQLLDQPGYLRFTGRENDSSLTNKLRVLGVFDDHDYGINNGDKFYQFRTESARLFMQFLKHSSSAEIDLTIMDQRAAAGKGVYGVKVMDFLRPPGQELLSDDEAAIEPSVVRRSEEPKLSDRSVAIFLLDCRSNKSPWKKGFPQKYLPDYEADFLGTEQWDWLEATLSRSTASVNVIVQGLQVHADRYFDGNLVEDWSRFPMAQHRLYQTVLKSGASAPVLVSGDVHMAELLRKDCRRRTPGDSSSASSSPRMLLEVTVSGM